LTANPASILLNPGITTSATQNVALSDPGYAGTYAASIACATSGLTPILQGVFQNPTVSVSGSILTITSPGQALGISLGCNVSVTTAVPQTLTVPVTISVSALGGLSRKRGTPVSGSAMLFTPATVAMQPRGTHAAASFDVGGVAGPYAADVSCPAGATIRTTTLGNRIELEQLSADAQATCMVTVTGAGGLSSEIPVRTYAAAGIGAATRLLPPGLRRIALGRTSVRMRVGETQTVSFAGSGPVEISGCEGIVAVRTSGNLLVATGRVAGSCALTLRGAGGASATLPIAVGALAAPVLPISERGKGVSP
jgi:hypothetical protein